MAMYTFREIKYFHPSGAGLPNGSHYQKGGFLNECRKNVGSFVWDKVIHNKRDEKSQCRGGMIVFAEDAEQISNMDILQHDEACIYSLGQFFTGTYVGDSGEVFNYNSVCLDISGLSSKPLLNLAEVIADRPKQKSVLVKDLNTSKIWQILKYSQLK